MRKYLSPNEGSFTSYDPKETTILERKTLLLALLADRSIPRFICAPKWYGKSLLAYQYAHCMFTSAEVLWVDSCDPRFIRDLDDGSFDVSAHLDSSIKLIVFDDLPLLNSLRLASILSIIKHLCDSQLEVIITTSFRVSAESYEDNKMIVNAIDMLLTEEEVHVLGGLGSDCSSIDSRIASWGFGGQEKRRQLSQEIISAPIRDRLDALSRLMIVIGQGTIGELSHIDFDLMSIDLANLRRDYPHCGIDSTLFSFKSLDLNVMERFDVLHHHLTEFLSYTSSHTVVTFLDSLLTLLRTHHEWELMSLIALYLCKGEQQGNAVTSLVPELLFEGMPCLALSLIENLDADKRSDNTVVLLELAACSMLHDEDRCRSLLQENGVRLSSIEAAYATILVINANGTLNKKDCETFQNYCEQAGIGLNHDCSNGVEARLLDTHMDPRELVCLLVSASINSQSEGLKIFNKVLTSGCSLRLTLRLLFTFLWCVSKVDESSSWRNEHKSSRSYTDAIRSFCASARNMLTRVGMMLSPNCYETAISHYLSKDAFCGESHYVSENLLKRYRETEAILADQLAQYRNYRYASRRNSATQVICDCVDLTREAKSDEIQDKNKLSVAPLSISVFGGFELKAGEMAIPSEKKLRTHAKALLTLLLVHRNRELPREWLEKSIWHLSYPEHARQSFYNVWSYTRRMFQEHGIDPAFMNLAHGIATFDTQNISSDLIDLDNLMQRSDIETCSPQDVLPLITTTVQIYRGELLPGSDIPQIVSYRTRYHNKVIALLYEGAKRLCGMGKLVVAQKVASKAFSFDKTREDTCLLLMKLLCESGQRSGAITTFLTHRQCLVEEFGIDPSKRLNKLYEEILEEVS